MKNKKRNVFIVTAIIVGALFLFSNLDFLTLFPTHQGTEYSNYYVSPDGKTMTYSDLYKYQDFMGLTSVHYLTDETGGQKYFPSAVDNTGFYSFLLELNGIDSSQFYAGGTHSLVCGFSPYDYNTNPYYDQIRGFGTLEWYVGSNSAGVAHCWKGNYPVNNMKALKDNIACFVQGRGFSIEGKVGVTNTGFYCEIDVNEANQDYLGINEEFVDSNPQIVFKIQGPKFYYYRLQDNKCTEVLILLSEKTTYDYENIGECQNNISTIPEEPTKPEPSGWGKILNKFKEFNEWITNIFNKLLGRA